MMHRDWLIRKSGLQPEVIVPSFYGYFCCPCMLLFKSYRLRSNLKMLFNQKQWNWMFYLRDNARGLSGISADQQRFWSIQLTRGGFTIKIDTWFVDVCVLIFTFGDETLFITERHRKFSSYISVNLGETTKTANP